MPVARIHRPHAHQIRARLPRTGDAAQIRRHIQAEFLLQRTRRQRQIHQRGDGRRAKGREPFRHIIGANRPRLVPCRRLLTRQRRRRVVAGNQPRLRKRPEIARGRINRMNAQIRLRITLPAHRHHLRPEPFNDALCRVPAQPRCRRGKGKVLRRHVRKLAAARIMQRAWRYGQRIFRSRLEGAVKAQCQAIRHRNQPIHVRRYAQHVARPNHIQRFRRRGKAQLKAPRRITLLVAGWCANAQPSRHGGFKTRSAKRVIEGERHWAMQCGFENRRVQPRHIRKPQP